MPWQNSLGVGLNKLWRHPLFNHFHFTQGNRNVWQGVTGREKQANGVRCMYRALICLHYIECSHKNSCLVVFNKVGGDVQEFPESIKDVGEGHNWLGLFFYHLWDDMLSRRTERSFLSRLSSSPTMCLFSNPTPCLKTGWLLIHWSMTNTTVVIEICVRMWHCCCRGLIRLRPTTSFIRVQKTLWFRRSHLSGSEDLRCHCYTDKQVVSSLVSWYSVSEKGSDQHCPVLKPKTLVLTHPSSLHVFDHAMITGSHLNRNIFHFKLMLFLFLGGRSVVSLDGSSILWTTACCPSCFLLQRVSNSSCTASGKGQFVFISGRQSSRCRGSMRGGRWGT